MKLRFPKLFLYFLGAIFIINLIQAQFTELLFDEAYYWYYAQNMAWGYFDHPPMVALLIKISGFLFNGELGVRFMSCLLSVCTVVFLWLMIDNAQKKAFVPHFFVLVFSMILVNAYGFFTLPDTPLLFFTALFLLIYKRFLKNSNWVLSVALGVTMAMLMYSKYHAVLVILFVLLSNIKLVANKYAWLAVISSLVCYTPHLLWLVQNDFVSIKYHLFERPNQPYEFFEFTGGYLLNLIVLFGLTFPFIYFSLYKSKPSDKFTRALVFLIYGVLLFFFLSSFQRRVQAQWIIVICVPMAVLVYNYMLKNSFAMKWIVRLGIANIVILLYLRVGLIYEPLFPITFETHGNKDWVAQLESKTGNTPVVFENSYRMAPMYSFYSGNSSFSLNNVRYRKNQYSIDNSEASMQHKKILMVSKYKKEGDISFSTVRGTQFYGTYIDNFESFRKLQCLVEKDTSFLEDSVISVAVYNPYLEDIALKKLKFGVAYLNKYKRVIEIRNLDFLTEEMIEGTLIARDTNHLKFQFPSLPEHKDLGYFKICISENGLYYGLNGESIKLH